MDDWTCRKIVYLKQEAAKARLALQKLCLDDQNLDDLLNDFDKPELIVEMQKLQKEAEDDAVFVIGEFPPFELHPFWGRGSRGVNHLEKH